MIGAGVMIIGGVVAAVLGVAAEGRSLEDIASPLSALKSAASGRSPKSISRTPTPQGAGT